MSVIRGSAVRKGRPVTIAFLGGPLLGLERRACKLVREARLSVPITLLADSFFGPNMERGEE